MSVQIIVTILFSMIIGLLMGVIGGGGGGMYVVILMLLLHQNAKTAAMTALVLSTITLSGSAYQYIKTKEYIKDYFLIICILDIIGTLLGNVVMKLLSENIIKIIIFCVLCISGLSPLLKIKQTKQDASAIAAAKEKTGLLVPIGLISGLITGMTGLGAGTMLSSLLIGLFDFPPFMAVGTTALVNFAGNGFSIIALWLGSAVLHRTAFDINIESLLTLGLGSAIGALFGAKLTSKINHKVLTVILAAMAIAPGIYLAMKR